MQTTPQHSRVLLVRPEFAERATILVGLSDGTIPLAAIPEAARRFFGEQQPQETMTVDGGIARIPLSGVIYRGASSAGSTDPDKLASNIREADSRPDVKSILLVVDSPGGTVQGTPEAADAVASAVKPIIAFVTGQAASAAYWIASGADQVFASPSAEVGSIGAFMAFFDLSGMFSQMGVRTEVISSGRYKGAGVMGTSLTAEQRSNLQEQVNAIAEDFKSQVQSNRYPKAINPDLMHGQMFRAKDATTHGLIDGIMRSEQQVRSLIG
jgi:signal peptide peptidase SppA